MIQKSEPLKVLVVDDTIVYRKVVGDVLAEFPGVEVVGTANNGKVALSRIDVLKPDLITLDVEMPEMNGLQLLQTLRERDEETGVVMLSTLTREGSEITIQALELGAFDFIPKPDGGTLAENKKAVKEALYPILRAFGRRQEIRKILRGKTPAAKPALKAQAAPSPSDVAQRMQRIATRPNRSEIVAIGISTGGPNALSDMLPKVPGDINVPILIVQHMPPVFTQSLAKSLNQKCALTVREARDGESLKPNTVLIAPGGKQMKVVAGADGVSRIIRITDDPPENSCKPSVDYLFRSVAQLYVGRATGVIMTGMGSDGTRGLMHMKKNGAYIIAQDEATCTVYGMPKAPVEAGIVDVVSPLGEIAGEITRTVKRTP